MYEKFTIIIICFSMILRSITVRIIRFQQRNKHELSDSYNANYQKNSQNPLIEDINLKANIFSFITMEILFYPVETIIHRLHIQVSIHCLSYVSTTYHQGLI